MFEDYCSCSEISSNRTSCTVEVESVGRVSFLIENEKNETIITQSNLNSKPKSQEKAEEFLILRRSSSNSVEIKRNSGFWKIRKLFKKKKDTDRIDCGRSTIINGGFDDKNGDTWMAEHGSVPDPDLSAVSEMADYCTDLRMVEIRFFQELEASMAVW